MGDDLSELSDEGLEDLFGDRSFVPSDNIRSDLPSGEADGGLSLVCITPIDGRRLCATLRSGPDSWYSGIVLRF